MLNFGRLYIRESANNKQRFTDPNTYLRQLYSKRTEGL